MDTRNIRRGGTVVLLLLASPVLLAHPRVPRDRIPPDIPPAVHQQIVKLYNSSSVDRCYAARALGQMGADAKDAVVFLEGLIDDSNSVRAVAYHGPFTSQFPLFPGQGTITSVGAEAARALGRIGTLDAVRVLYRHAAKAYGDRVLSNALDGLGEIRDPLLLKEWGIVERLLLFLDAADRPNAYVAARALGNLGDVAEQVELYDKGGQGGNLDPNLAGKIRRQIEGRRTLLAPALEPLLLYAFQAFQQDRHEDTCVTVIALGKAGDERLVKPLLMLYVQARQKGYHSSASSRQENVYAAIGYALSEITGEEFAQDFEKWRLWFNANERTLRAKWRRVVEELKTMEERGASLNSQ